MKHYGDGECAFSWRSLGDPSRNGHPYCSLFTSGIGWEGFGEEALRGKGSKGEGDLGVDFEPVPEILLGWSCSPVMHGMTQ